MVSATSACSTADTCIQLVDFLRKWGGGGGGGEGGGVGGESGE